MYVLTDTFCPQCRNPKKCRHEPKLFYVQYFFRLGTMVTDILDNAKSFKTKEWAEVYLRKWTELGVPAINRIKVLNLSKKE